jgi:aminoglycoside phosphotransferase (APT) family kinase protein
MSLYTVNRGLREIRDNFSGAVGARIPASARDGERLIAAFRALAAEVEVAEPWCVVHGDAHIRNIYVEPSGRPSFLDWQLVQRGPWYLDVGYHIATMLSIEDRRRHESALVAEYVDRLVAAGIERPTDADVERGLRRSFVYGFYLWAITLRVDHLAIAALLHRLGTAVDDHDALEELTP